MGCNDARNLQMTRSELLQQSTAELKEVGWEDPRELAEQLMMVALEVERYRLYLHADMPVGGKGKERFDNMFSRSIKGEPLQYIVGQVEFHSIELEIHPGVLIPRPETEQLVDHAKRISGDGIRRAMDIGCGSGAITLALFEQQIAHEIVAVDVSRAAIRTTIGNASRLGFFPVDITKADLNEKLPENTVLLQRTSLDPNTKKEHLDKLWLTLGDAFSEKYNPPIQPFPLIVSNPPYVTSEEWEELPVHIRDHEPKVALESGADGLDAHRNLAQCLPEWLSTGGAFVGEIGSKQGKRAVQIHADWAKRTKLHQDYSRLDRFVIAYK
jgi:release factor glutamine methyltransferase